MKPVIMLILVTAIVIALLLLKRAGETPNTEAQEELKQGALVIDVRSPEEFASDHLTAAINIPLEEIETALPLQVRDKNQVLLLHCQSGVRSAIAAHKMLGMGYTHASNLGSLSRAKKILTDAGLQ
ncbi:MAG: rhodanese-like domain-containing protein [Verrucomicrobiota bacterium]